MDDALTTRGLFERMARESRESVPLGELLDAFSERAFGLFLLVAILPAFLPLPAGAGVISGPLVAFCGLQLLLLAEHPWLPRWLQQRPVATANIERFQQRMARPLGWLERISRPRWPAVIDHPAAKILTGAHLLLLGLLLLLPIPLTNYVFGSVLLIYAVALIERDGLTMVVAWTLGFALYALMGFYADEVVTAIRTVADTVAGWF